MNLEGTQLPFKDPIGQPCYMSPECINGNYFKKTDVWSLGVIMYLLLTNKLPYDGKTDEDIFALIKHYPPDLTSPEVKKKSLFAIDLLKKMLFKDPITRISANDALKHVWI